MGAPRAQWVRLLPVLLLAGIGSFLAGTRFGANRAAPIVHPMTGRVIYRKEDTSIPIAATYTMSIGEIRTGIEAAGFSFDRLDENLPRQHIAIFRKAET